MLLKVFDFIQVFFSFWPRCVACGILIPQPGIKPAPSAVNAWSPNHSTTREFPKYFFLKSKSSMVSKVSKELKVFHLLLSDEPVIFLSTWTVCFLRQGLFYSSL